MLPPELRALLDAEDPAARETEWAAFVAMHSRLLLHTARSVHRDHDAAMDAYAFLLAQLRQDEFHRLRGYASDGRSKFTTWLVVVARRLCLDHVRQRYGRAQEGGAREEQSLAVRRRLVDHIAEAIDTAEIVDPLAADAETQLRAADLTQALTGALAAFDPGDRLLLRLRFEDDLPAREIARLMRLPTPFHVYRRLNSVLAKLREALGRRGIQGSDP